ncbi:MAG: hypothetical protein HYX63_17980 [Gammaproteobacteria bacterium]|nr:hypothetical protein [Gammaproteobacteria bacterium]
MRALAVCALGLSVVAAPTPAADAAGNYAVWGVGQASCNQFVAAYGQATAQDYKSYLAGYLTAYNTVAHLTYQATGKNTATDNLKFLHDHCVGHRMDSFERAIQALLANKEAQRQQGAATQSNNWGRPPAPVQPTDN